MVDVVEKKFPSNYLVPKSETGVLNFLKKYPQYNGEGVTIAIFDSGVDPRAAGLKTTPNGEVKVIERYDCSGCGDVDISKLVTATAEDTVTGLSGRTLKITEQMKKDNINGNEYRVGLKNLLDLYPKSIRDKILANYKLKNWDDKHIAAVAEVFRESEALDLANPSTNGNSTLPLKEKLKKENASGAAEYLSNFEKKYANVKSTYDCIVYRTADHWVAVIDVTEKGDLENALFLGEYSKTYDVKSVDDSLSVTINVHDDGSILEIVGMCSAHGTHVASIATGNHSPDNSELDGVAPAAKIVSFTIGDNRLGSMETGTALIRAIIKVMELCNAGRRVHVINMSYGEHGHWSNSGRIGNMMMEVVNKYGVVWIASAGNHGPALCSIGSPPDIKEPICIGVGAYVSPEMMEAEYASREKLPGNAYTWTSRDPCIDGGQAITVCAPGAAIASIPEFTLTKQQLMNGTSMAAPHVAGAVALLLSGLVQNNIKYSPYSVKRALWNSATKLGYVDKFAQGNGLLNVELAYEHLLKNKDEVELNVCFNVKVGPKKTKGILIRQEEIIVSEHNVSITPAFINDKEVDVREKINFNMRLTLVSSESWVQSGSFLDLSYAERAISVKVDPTGLEPGVHTASIKVYDSRNVTKGTVFEIPVTVVIPLKLDQNFVIRFNQVAYKHNTIMRYFVNVPKCATWAVLNLKPINLKPQLPSKYFVHTVQILPNRNCKTVETQKIISVYKELTHVFRCEESNVLEVCIAKYWSNGGESVLEASLEFKGIRTNGAHTMHSANGIHRIDLTSLQFEDILPSLQMKTAVMVLKPSESKILTLTERDIIPPQRQIYRNVLSYSLHLMKAQEVSFSMPFLTELLYESEFESQFWMVFDSNKMMVACGDYGSSESYVKLEKGDYVVRLQIRHENREHLERLIEAVMLARFKLVTSIPLDIYNTHTNAIIMDKKCGTCTMTGNIAKPIYVAPLPNEKTKVAPNLCSWLEGNITLCKDEAGRKVDSPTFKYILTEGPPIKKNGATTTKDATKNKFDEYKESLRDYQNGMISKLDLAEAEVLYKELVEAHPTFVAAHIALIQKLDSSELKNNLPFTYRDALDKSSNVDAAKLVLKRIVDLADLVIKGTDSNALLAYYGLKADTRTDATKIKTVMDKQKTTLLEAYSKKTIALVKLHLIDLHLDKDSVLSTELTDELNGIFEEIGKFTDYTDLKFLLLVLWHAFFNQHYGRMLKTLQRLYEEKLEKVYLQELLHVATETKWSHIVTALEKMLVTNYPTDYPIF